MKTWIIVLAIVFVVLELVKMFLANYIRNDKTERIKYYFYNGVTTLGVIHGIVFLLGVLSCVFMRVIERWELLIIVYFGESQ